MTYHRVCKTSKMTDVMGGTGIAYRSVIFSGFLYQ